jgi:sugar/nucleoside kinase (ribokinase family)
MAVVEGQSIFAPAIKATPLDTTGAGDLLVAAYIWGDLRGASAEECLRWAVLYAGLSIATPTGEGVRCTGAAITGPTGCSGGHDRGS